MTLRIYSIAVIIALLVGGCASKRKQAELLEASKPAWLKERPSHPDYYFGIGTISKVGSPLLYEDKAKERALVDLASQINTQINSETTLHRIEDMSGVHEYLSSRVKATSSEFLEGYEFVDKWEDESYYYVYLRLSKHEFMTKKRERKDQAIQHASLKYTQGIEQESAKKYIEAMRLYAACLDLLSGYVNEETTATIDGKRIDLVEKSQMQLTNLARSFAITASQQRVEAQNAQKIDEGKIIFSVYSGKDNLASNVPVRFSYTGGYLINELGKSDKLGAVPSPPLNITGSKETLSVKIDLVQLSRQITHNLFVRKIVEKEFAKKVDVMIVPAGKE